MDSRVLEIVVLLMSHIKEHQGQLDNFDDITNYLQNSGYTENEISSAYSLVIDMLQSDSEVMRSDGNSKYSTRIISETERKHFSTAAMGYLYQLKHLGLLTESQFEMILDRAAYIGSSTVDLEQIKIVVESVLFKEPDFIEMGRQRVYFVHRDDDSVN